MCGRFVFTDPSRIKSLLPDALIDDQIVMEFRPNYNIAPTQPVLAVLNDGSRTLKYTRWGLIPSWAKEPSIGAKLINARRETLAEKPMFRSLLAKRRCLILADGFYEWRRDKTRKQPFFIRRRSQDPLALAGLWDTWKGPQGTILSSTIVTTAANELLSPIHARMPVMLAPASFPAWLSAAPVSPAILARCLDDAPPEDLEAYAVSGLVNSPANNIPECILPLPG